MKILMIAPTPFFADRGCHVRIYEEIKALQKMGHTLKLVTYNLGHTPKGIKVSRIPNIFFWYKKLEAGPSWWKPFLDLLLLIKSVIEYRADNYDLIHAHLHEGTLIGYFVRFFKFKKVPLVFDFQGSLTGELLAHHFIREHQNLHGFFRNMEKIINKLPDIIITSSMGSYHELINYFRIDKNKVVYIRDGVGEGFSKIVSERVKNKLRTELKIPKKSKVVMYIGVLSEYQGVNILLYSISRIAKQIANVHFVVAGYPNVAKYKLMAEKMGLAKLVTFPGRIPYLKSAEYLSVADVTVSPKISKTEANGKLYSYAAAGKVPVVFDSVVNKEILGDLGIYAKFNDKEDFTKKLFNTIRNIDKLKPVSQRLRAKSLKDFSWKKSANDIESIYRSLLKV